MPAKTLPDFDRLVSGNDYHRPDGPENDAASTEGATANQVLGAPASMDAPLQPVSLATKSEDAPSHGAFLMTNLHDKNYLDPTKPHISPESQKG